jgi:hypothetical protein
MGAMRWWLCMVSLAGLMAARLPARADGEGLPEIRIKVGEAYQLHLGFIIVGLVCDDTSVVRVEDGGDHLRLVGLAPGRTKCGFWSNPQVPRALQGLRGRCHTRLAQTATMADR